jgi:hypothetical protein
MSKFIQGKELRNLVLGRHVTRATAVLPDTAYGALFTITGGKVIITSLVGCLTIACNATATNLKVTATPTTGTAVDVATDVAVASKEIGTLIGISAYGSAVVVTNAGATPISQTPFVVNTGTLGVTTSATQVGSATWDLTYIPIDDGAAVVAA